MTRRTPFAVRAIAAVVALAPWAASANGLSGHPTVESGDTLRVGDVRVRLLGIEAPAPDAGCTRNDLPYDCARLAATALMDLTAGTLVACVHPEGVGAVDGVAVMRCTAAGYDLAEGMAYTGWARAWPRTDNPYLAHEREARTRGHGVWRGGTAPPTGW